MMVATCCNFPPKAAATKSGSGTMKIKKRIAGHAHRRARHPPKISVVPTKNGSSESMSRS